MKKFVYLLAIIFIIPMFISIANANAVKTNDRLTDDEQFSIAKEHQKDTGTVNLYYPNGKPFSTTTWKNAFPFLPNRCKRMRVAIFVNFLRCETSVIHVINYCLTNKRAQRYGFLFYPQAF